MAHLLFSILIRSTAVYQLKKDIEKNVVFLKNTILSCIASDAHISLDVGFHYLASYWLLVY